MKGKNITVFCSSSNDASDAFKASAVETGIAIAKREAKLIFGGSAMGLMRAVADAALDNGADVLGVMPEFMKEVEWNYDRLTSEQMMWTSSLATRKDVLIGDADAIIVLPGAVGTLEELGEALSLKRLGRFFAPIVLVNVEGFYDSLDQWLQSSVDENLMRSVHSDMWYLADDVADAFNYLEQGHEWPRDAVTFAAR